MYMLVTPKGARYRRLDYRFAVKRRTLALGIYPIVACRSAASDDNMRKSTANVHQSHNCRRCAANTIELVVTGQRCELWIPEREQLTIGGRTNLPKP